jgi:hypothetical protein
MSVEKSTATIDAGAVTLSVCYVDQDGRRNPGVLQPEQGVSIRVLGDVDGTQEQLLRFDCFDREPHYHYGSHKQNEIVLMDVTAGGNSIGWAVAQLRSRLPDMVRRSGYDAIADALEANTDAAAFTAKIDEVAASARETALKWRRTVTHNGSAQLAEIPGTEVIEAGNIRFGLEFRELPTLNARGLAIHVLSDVAGQEIELLAFDCFDKNAHYHYGPRNKDLRHYWDRTLVPDPLRWVLDRFKEGKIPNMLQSAGYSSIADGLDTTLLAETVEHQIEPKALAIRKANVAA